MSETKIERVARRNVAIAGPVAAVFSHTCRALGEDQQKVATKLVSGWNRRNARRAQRALHLQASALVECGPLVSSAGSLTPPHQNTTRQS